MSENPYRVLGARVPPLIGRTRALDRLLEHLGGEDPEHLSVVGPALYGKSVFLSELARHFQEGGADGWSSVLLDLRHRNPGDDEDFRQALADALRPALESVRPDLVGYLELEGVRLKERLQAIVQELAAAGGRILIVFDGFDEALANPRITESVWSNMRSLARQPVLCYVTGSRRPLRELCRTEESRGSDLWEVFHDVPLQIGCFDEQDEKDLLAPFAERGTVIDDASRKAISSWTGGVPLLTIAFLQTLWEATAVGQSPDAGRIDMLGERVAEERRELLAALWDDLSAELRTDLADLAERDLRSAHLPEVRLAQLEQLGFARREGKRVRGSCKLMLGFAAASAVEVGGLQRLFGEAEGFERNARALLELRLAHLELGDSALRGYVEQAIRHMHPEPRHAIVWIRSIVDRGLDLIWAQELRDGVGLPQSWLAEWERAGVRNVPDDGHGRLPAERGRQIRLLRMAVGTGLRGQSVRRVSKHISRPTALLLEHLQSVGNFGQHLDDEVTPGFAAAVCLTAVAFCHSLSTDLAR